MWYQQNVTNEEISQMKTNWLGQDFLKLDYPRLASLLEKIPDKDRLYYRWYWDPVLKWHMDLPPTIATPSPSNILRLRPDWERPEPKWYDGMSTYALNNLQENEKTLSLLEWKYSDIARNMRRIPKGLVQYWDGGGAGWGKSASSGSSLLQDMTYRLDPDWRIMGCGDGK